MIYNNRRDIKSCLIYIYKINIMVHKWEEIAENEWSEVLIDNEWEAFGVIKEIDNFKKTVNRITNISNEKKLDMSYNELDELTDIDVLNKIFEKKGVLIKWWIHKLKINLALQERISLILHMNIPSSFVSWTMHSYSPIKFFEMIDTKIKDLNNSI